MKIGARVMKKPMWKFEHATGVIIKASGAYTVVKWDDINGEWHYTPEQAKDLIVIQDEEKV
jgi:hypothetical protein